MLEIRKREVAHSGNLDVVGLEGVVHHAARVEHSYIAYQICCVEFEFLGAGRARGDEVWVYDQVAEEASGLQREFQEEFLCG